jgi:hypothetical protein
MVEHLGSASDDGVAELPEWKEIVERPWEWYREQQARCRYCKWWYGSIADAQQHCKRQPMLPHFPAPPQAKQGGGSSAGTGDSSSNNSISRGAAWQPWGIDGILSAFRAHIFGGDGGDGMMGVGFSGEREVRRMGL